MDEIYGLDQSSLLVETRGHVTALPNRAVAFPNLYQHQVQPFSLVDFSRSGVRRILAVFLVDPTVRVPSTSIVAPQQADWLATRIQREGRAHPLNQMLPAELVRSVALQVPDVLSMEEAKALRLELMDERTQFVQKSTQRTFEAHFNLCEH